MYMQALDNYVPLKHIFIYVSLKISRNGKIGIFLNESKEKVVIVI